MTVIIEPRNEKCAASGSTAWGHLRLCINDHGASSAWRMAAGHDSVRDGVSDEMNRGAAGAADRSAKLQEERLCSSCSAEIFSHRSSQALLDKGLPFLRARWTPCTRYFALLSNATESLHLGTGDLSAAATGDGFNSQRARRTGNSFPDLDLLQPLRALRV